ncbi:hypothetical protein NDA13_000819 [Ustilago tritici]|nr:hypothetical protein NDA13_000819 [Ustilago tritici]
MPPSIESSTSSASTGNSTNEPKTPPLNRNTSAPTPEKLSTPTSFRGRFASLTRSAGKSTSNNLSAPAPAPASAGSTPRSTAPLEETAGRIEKLDLTKGAPDSTMPKHPPSAPVCRRASDDDVFDSSHPHKIVDEMNEHSPLQKVLQSPKAQPLPGHPGNLTSAQTHALQELTAALKRDGALHTSESETPSHQETQLLRFLRARNFNPEAARTMYLKAEAWKKEIQLDHLISTFSFSERDIVASHGWSMYFHKTDKLGRPIFIQDLGNMDTTSVFRNTTPERVIQNFAVTLELAVRHRYEACTISSGRWVDDNYTVVNLAGLGLSTFWSMKGQLQQLLGILDNNFPELSGRVQIINAPYMFSTIWSWIKGWLPTVTVEKIDIAGADYHERIWEFVKKEDWPKSLGGECECEGGCGKKDDGPWDKRLVRGAADV